MANEPGGAPVLLVALGTLKPGSRMGASDVDVEVVFRRVQIVAHGTLGRQNVMLKQTVLLPVAPEHVRFTHRAGDVSVMAHVVGQSDFDTFKLPVTYEASVDRFLAVLIRLPGWRPSSSSGEEG